MATDETDHSGDDPWDVFELDDDLPDDESDDADFWDDEELADG